MINALQHIKRLLPIGLLVAGILCGCSDSDAPLPVTEAQADGAITVVLRVPTDGSDIISREDPMPGEDGNGREQGILNENEIHDVNILFYVGDGLNPANPAAVSLSGIYISDMSSAQVTAEELPFEKVYTIKLSPSDLSDAILLETSTVSFITVANAGRDLTNEFESLEALRKHCFDYSWTTTGSRNAADCNRFIMTTAYDSDPAGIVNINGALRTVGSNRLKKSEQSGTGEGPEWYGETTVQRICARIDIMYPATAIAAGTTDNTISGLNYKVLDTDNIVHLTNALPVNVMQHPSYLLARVTDGIPTTWTETGLGPITWGGIEKSTGTPSAPANYVIDPRTLLKESEVADADIVSWYGNTRATVAAADIVSPSSGALSEYYSGALPVPETRYGCTHHTILGYANENIQSPARFNSRFITGIVFRAIFQPREWVTRSGDSYVTENVDDNTWATMTDKSFTRYMPTVEGTNTITDSRAMYFANHADALSYSAAHPEDQAILTRFDNGVCYYNLWLRHYNDESADPQQTYPMEYVIVRNNIYRVALTFSGVGNPTADLRAPDTMMARIFVRKWNLRKENQPLEF